MAREAIAEMVSRSEILHLDAPQQPKAVSISEVVPWEWFGKAEIVIFDEPSTPSSHACC
jgi:hypothetical protein